MRPVVIVGAGLAGLSCARDLTAAGIPVAVLEAGDGIGGRVRTDVVDGFRLDRGFQVLLSAYPTTRAAVDLPALRPRPFYSGAIVLSGGRLHRLANPLRHPGGALSTARSPLTGAGDLLALARLALAARGPLAAVFSAPESTTEQALDRAGVSAALRDGFLRPFLGGVFLDRELETTSRMLEFLLRMFARAPAVVPERGMQAIPDALAAGVPAEAVTLGATVTAVAPDEVALADGRSVAAGAVVIATDGAAAAQLHDGVTAPAWCHSTTLYFTADAPPDSEPVLYLDGDGSGPANSAVVMSNASPAYAPPGRALISAAIVGRPPGDPATLAARVREQLERFFGPAARRFEHLRTYEIDHALPAQPPGWLQPPHRPAQLAPGIYVCGDHREHASIEGAIVSGRRAAHAYLTSA